jgi:chemotaxis protein histidine kinase CheA
VSATRLQVRGQIASELETDRKYQALASRMLKLAESRAQSADVRGVQRVVTTIKANDQALGALRPDAVASMIAAVEDQLDAARRLRLERDRWALRAPELRAYRSAMAPSLDRLQQMTPLLEDIKSLSGSGPDAIGVILDGAARIQKVLARLEPPSELRDVHNLFTSAVQLADNAAKIRREAALTGSINRAWDASSAAAGSLMLATKARTDLLVALRPPQVSQ